MAAPPVATDKLIAEDSPRIRRLKQRLLTAPYQICMERARHFTRSYMETEGEHPAIRNAKALRETLTNQPIHIYADEWIVGNKTDKYLAPVLAPERGDSLRALQLELDVLSEKERPFFISDEDKKVFKEQILPYWLGKSLRDRKGEEWIEAGIIEPVRGSPPRTLRQIFHMLCFARHVGRDNLKMIAGIKKGGSRHRPGRALLAWKARDELSKNNPNMALYCYDVQGHLHLPVERVVEEGFLGIKERALKRLSGLDPQEDGYADKKAFLEAVAICMDASCTYADRFRALAEAEAVRAEDTEERGRLQAIAGSLSHAPALPARNFREAVQAVWFALLIGLIQYGMNDVLGIGRADQYRYPLFRGTWTREG